MTKEDQRHSEITALLGRNLEATESTRDAVADLSTNLKLHEKDDDHIHAAQDKRLDELEKDADASGANDISALQERLVERKKYDERWRGRFWGVFFALLLSGIMGLVTHYLATR